MLNADRTEFEVQVAVLFGGFPAFLTPAKIDAYWRGLQKMHMSTFVRCVDHALSEGGCDKLPSVNEIWQISHALKRIVPTNTTATTEVPFEPVAAHANKCLMRWLMLHPNTIPDDLLAKLVARKNKLADAYLDVFSEDKTITGSEIREAMFKGFNAVVKQHEKASRAPLEQPA